MTFLKLREIVLCQYLLVIFSCKELQHKTNQILLEISKFYFTSSSIYAFPLQGLLKLKPIKSLCKYQNFALDSSTSPHGIKQKTMFTIYSKGFHTNFEDQYATSNATTLQRVLVYAHLMP